jgi:hypothetical protein
MLEATLSKSRFLGQNSSISSYQNKKLLAIVAILMASIVVDISLVRLYDLVSKQLIPLESKQVLFSVISITILTSQFILLEFIKPKKTVEKERIRLPFVNLYIITKAVQYILASLVVLIIVQIQLNSYYSTFALIAVILGSYGFCISILIQFIVRVVGLVSFTRNTLVVILFVIALCNITINSAIAMIDASFRLSYRPQEIKPILGGSVDVSKGRLNLLDSLYFLSYIFSFISAWIATAVLLIYYSKRVGKFKYWLVILTPVVFFLGQFLALFADIFSTAIYIDPFFLVSLINFVATLSKPLGGLMLGIAFWSMARLGERNTEVQKSLNVSGLGVLLLFTCNQGILMAISPYPPFGMSTITLLGLSAYLTVIGIYSSSFTLSHNSELRKYIRNLASSRLLDSLASAEMEKQIEKTVSQIIMRADNMEDKTGIPSSMTENEAKTYLEEVLKEVRESKNK